MSPSPQSSPSRGEEARRAGEGDVKVSFVKTRTWLFGNFKTTTYLSFKFVLSV